MTRHVLLYGLAGGVLIAVLRVIEYRYLLVGHSVEIYGGLIAALFAALGIWLGLRLTGVRERVIVQQVVHEVVREVPVPAPAATPTVMPTVAATPAPTAFVRDTTRVEALGLTPRELEILELIAAGLSTREIAGRIFVSENTVKTHAGRLFDKLGARRRTQAVQIGRQLALIP